MIKSEPREFWINDNAEGDGSKNWSDTPWYGYIHVIEYQALEVAIEKINDLHDEIRELESTNKKLDEANSAASHAWDVVEQIKKERDVFTERMKLVDNVLIGALVKMQKTDGTMALHEIIDEAMAEWNKSKKND